MNQPQDGITTNAQEGGSVRNGKILRHHWVHIPRELRGTKRSRTRKCIVADSTHNGQEYVFYQASKEDEPKPLQPYPGDNGCYGWGKQLGSGQLARAILREVSTKDLATRHWFDFQQSVIQHIRTGCWAMPAWEILDWLEVSTSIEAFGAKGTRTW